MKNFKKLAAFALAATMSLGLLTACGGGTKTVYYCPERIDSAPDRGSSAYCGGYL